MLCSGHLTLLPTRIRKANIATQTTLVPVTFSEPSSGNYAGVHSSNLFLASSFFFHVTSIMPQLSAFFSTRTYCVTSILSCKRCLYKPRPPNAPGSGRGPDSHLDTLPGKPGTCSSSLHDSLLLKPVLLPRCLTADDLAPPLRGPELLK